MALKLPVGQKRLTNVAVVRMKTHGIRFEIACYKNKVLNWREGIEKDIEEVLQTETVFTNVSKAIIAKEKDLQKAFGTVDLLEICKKILKDGDVQVSDREREVHMEGLWKDIVQIIVERCVHPQTGRQLTAPTVESALKSTGFSVQPDQAAKRQALKAMETLEAKMPESFARAKMRLQMICPESLLASIRKHVVEVCAAKIESESHNAGASAEESQKAPAANGDAVARITFVCDPSQYRELDRLATVVYGAENVSLQVLTQTVLCEVATQMSSELPKGAPPERPAPATGGYVADKPSAKKGFRCSVCQVDFEDAAAYRAHCRSEWHNFNLKRKVKGLPPLSEEDFAEVGLDMREGFHGAD